MFTILREHYVFPKLCVPPFPLVSVPEIRTSHSVAPHRLSEYASSERV
jgi:hypothetical protein